MNWQTFIPGVPKPQGSKTQGVGRNGKPFMREDNKGTKPWRKLMVKQLQDAGGRPLVVFDSAVWVRLRFVFLRPKSHAPNSLPTSKLLGDVDKLTRNVLDALTQARVITDDKFVVQLRDVEKVYGPNPGVHIEIGSAVPNPFADVSSFDQVPGSVLISCQALESWEPSPEALTAQRLEEYDNRSFWEAAIGGAEPDVPGREGI
jgi:Holliday junction resolvase RusA-like endonuclease